MIPHLLPRPAAPSLVVDLLSGVLDSRVALTRASSGFYFDGTGTLQQAASNAARFDHDPATLAPLGLLREQQATNMVRNPRAESATAGTPGTAPTYWSFFNNGSGVGVSMSVVGTGTESGIPYVDVRFFGAAASATSFAVWPEQSGQIAATAGQTWTGSIYIRLVSGSLNGLAPTVIMQERNSSGTMLANSPVPITPTTSGLAAQRWTNTRTLNQATCASVLATFYANVAAGPVDATFRFGAPQIESGSFASSPILPPVGALASATRAQEAIAIPLPPGTPGPAGISAAIAFDQATNSGADNLAGYFAVTDNAAASQVYVQFDATGLVATDSAATAGDLGNFRAAGAVQTAGFALGSPLLVLGLNGQTAAASGANPVGAYSTVDLANGASTNVTTPCGHLRRLLVWPRPLSAAELAAATA